MTSEQRNLVKSMIDDVNVDYSGRLRQSIQTCLVERDLYQSIALRLVAWNDHHLPADMTLVDILADARKLLEGHP